MLIRPARLDDIPKLISLAREAETAAHWTEAQYRSALVEFHPRRVLLVADDEELLGFVVGADIAGEWELENIVVAAGVRRRGVGKAMLCALLDSVRRSAGTAIFLEVRESNRSARQLYERTGFIEKGVRRGYYHNPPEDAILYKKIVSKTAPEIG